jgi:hypothetical protein
VAAALVEICSLVLEATFSPFLLKVLLATVRLEFLLQFLMVHLASQIEAALAVSGKCDITERGDLVIDREFDKALNPGVYISCSHKWQME